MSGEPRDPRQRLLDVWADWETSYREPPNGWTDLEKFREWFERDRDRMADQVRGTTLESVADDVAALHDWITAGGELRVAVRGVDNIADARARMLANLETLGKDLSKNSSANSGKTPHSKREHRSKRASNRGAGRASVPAVPATTSPTSPPATKMPEWVRLFLEAHPDMTPGERDILIWAGKQADEKIAEDRRKLREAKTFAERFRVLRGARTQGQFGAFLHVPENVVSAYENAHHKSGRMPRTRARVAMAIKSGADRDYLLVEGLADDELAVLTREDEALLP